MIMVLVLAIFLLSWLRHGKGTAMARHYVNLFRNDLTLLVEASLQEAAMKID